MSVTNDYYFMPADNFDQFISEYTQHKVKGWNALTAKSDILKKGYQNGPYHLKKIGTEISVNFGTDTVKIREDVRNRSNIPDFADVPSDMIGKDLIHERYDLANVSDSGVHIQVGRLARRMRTDNREHLISPEGAYIVTVNDWGVSLREDREKLIKIMSQLGHKLDVSNGTLYSDTMAFLASHIEHKTSPERAQSLRRALESYQPAVTQTSQQTLADLMSPAVKKALRTPAPSAPSVATFDADKMDKTISALTKLAVPPKPLILSRDGISDVEKIFFRAFEYQGESRAGKRGDMFQISDLVDIQYEQQRAMAYQAVNMLVNRGYVDNVFHAGNKGFKIVKTLSQSKQVMEKLYLAAHGVSPTVVQKVNAKPVAEKPAPQPAPEEKAESRVIAPPEAPVETPNVIVEAPVPAVQALPQPVTPAVANTTGLSQIDKFASRFAARKMPQAVDVTPDITPDTAPVAETHYGVNDRQIIIAMMDMDMIEAENNEVKLKSKKNPLRIRGYNLNNAENTYLRAMHQQVQTGRFALSDFNMPQTERDIAQLNIDALTSRGYMKQVGQDADGKAFYKVIAAYIQDPVELQRLIGQMTARMDIDAKRAQAAPAPAPTPVVKTVPSTPDPASVETPAAPADQSTPSPSDTTQMDVKPMTTVTTKDIAQKLSQLPKIDYEFKAINKTHKMFLDFYKVQFESGKPVLLKDAGYQTEKDYNFASVQMPFLAKKGLVRREKVGNTFAYEIIGTYSNDPAVLENNMKQASGMTDAAPEAAPSVAPESDAAAQPNIKNIKFFTAADNEPPEASAPTDNQSADVATPAQDDTAPAAPTESPAIAAEEPVAEEQIITEPTPETVETYPMAQEIFAAYQNERAQMTSYLNANQAVPLALLQTGESDYVQVSHYKGPTLIQKGPYFTEKGPEIDVTTLLFKSMDAKVHFEVQADAAPEQSIKVTVDEPITLGDDPLYENLIQMLSIQQPVAAPVATDTPLSAFEQEHQKVLQALRIAQEQNTIFKALSPLMAGFTPSA